MSKPIGFDPATGLIVIQDNGVFPARSLTASASLAWPGRIQIDNLAGRGEQNVMWSDVTSLDGFYEPASMEDALAYLRGEFEKGPTVSATFVQVIPATVWRIQHDLGFNPSVILEDTAGDPFSGDTRHPDVNTVTITFGFPVSGTAYLS